MAEHKKQKEEPITETGKSRRFISFPADDEIQRMLNEIAAEDAGHPDNANISHTLRTLIYQEYERRRQVKRVRDRLEKKGVHLPRH